MSDPFAFRYFRIAPDNPAHAGFYEKLKKHEDRCAAIRNYVKGCAEIIGFELGDLQFDAQAEDGRLLTAKVVNIKLYAKERSHLESIASKFGKDIIISRLPRTSQPFNFIARFRMRSRPQKACEEYAADRGLVGHSWDVMDAIRELYPAGEKQTTIEFIIGHPGMKPIGEHADHGYVFYVGHNSSEWIRLFEANGADAITAAEAMSLAEPALASA